MNRIWSVAAILMAAAVALPCPALAQDPPKTDLAVQRKALDDAKRSGDRAAIGKALAELRAAADKQATDENNKSDPGMKSVAAPAASFADFAIADHPNYVAAVEAAAEQPVIDTPAGGRTKSLGSTIITKLAEFPEVALSTVKLKTSNQDPVCSAVLIDPRYLLTAAHCVCENLSVVKFGLSLVKSKSWPDPGLLDLYDQVIMPEAVRCAAPARPGRPAVTRSEYVRSLRGNDIALLRLKEPVPASAKIVPIPRPQADAVAALINAAKSADMTKRERWLHVVGYGFTSLASPQAGAAKSRVRVPMLEPDCYGGKTGADDRSGAYGCVPGREILSLDPQLPGKPKPDPAGPCPGDSGGGAFVETTRDGKTGYTLVGLVSRSITRPPGQYPVCGDGAVYTLLTGDHIKWIDQKIAAGK